MKWTILSVVAVLLVAALAYSAASSGVVVQTTAVRRDSVREFVDEQAQTRLPVTHLVTMPIINL